MRDAARSELQGQSWCCLSPSQAFFWDVQLRNLACFKRLNSTAQTKHFLCAQMEPESDSTSRKWKNVQENNLTSRVIFFFTPFSVLEVWRGHKCAAESCQKHKAGQLSSVGPKSAAALTWDKGLILCSRKKSHISLTFIGTIL